MKISEMTNDQAAEAMIRISAAFSFICEDSETMGIIDELQNMGKAPLIEAIPRILPKFCAHAFRKHKHSLYEIIGALCGKPAKDIGKMNFAETVAMVKESYDEILRDFFTSSAPSPKKNGGESV